MLTLASPSSIERVPVEPGHRTAWRAAQGIPAVAFGPGSIRQAHTKNEFIEERELLAGAAAFGAFMRSGGGG